MNTEKKNTKPVFSIPLLILDFVGVVFLAISFVEFTHVFQVVPTALQFNHYPAVFLVLGILCMVPFILDILKQTLKQH